MTRSYDWGVTVDRTVDRLCQTSRMRIPILILASLILTACSGGSTADTAANTADTEASTETAAAATTAAPTTVKATTTTTQAATTEPPTTPPPTTAPPVTNQPGATPGVAGLMWESAVDPERVNVTEGQPTFTVGAVTGYVQSYIAVDTAQAEGNFADDCEGVISYGQQTGDIGTADGRCLFVQIRFDVADEVPDDGQASIVPAAYVGVDGVQLGAASLDGGFAYGGTVDNITAFQFANADPGGALRIDVYGGDYETIKLDVPAELLPINFD